MKSQPDPKALFEYNEKGDLVTHPVLGFVAADLAEICVLLRMRYSADSQDTAKQIQLVLTPPQALELADLMTKYAKCVLANAADEAKGQPKH
jgi:hypothetical protein